MKYLLPALFLLSACGSAPGANPPGGTVSVVTQTTTANPIPTHEYKLVVSTVGSSFAPLIWSNHGDPDEVQFSPGPVVGPQTYIANARTAVVEITALNTNAINTLVQLYYDGVLRYTFNLAPGDSTDFGGQF